MVVAMVPPVLAYVDNEEDEAAAKRRKIVEMAFGGEDPAAADPVDQALFGRFQAKFRPRRMCTFFEEGKCSKGASCTFAHSLEELHPDAHAEQQWAAANYSSAAAASQVLGLVESNAPAPGEEVSFLSLATGPRDFGGGAKPKALCRFFLHHPTYCLQGDSCQNAHGLSELGLDDKSVSIKSSSGPIAAVSLDDGGWGGKGKGLGKDLGKEMWWGPLGFKGGFGWDKGGYDKGGWSIPTSFSPYSKGKVGGYEKGCGFGKGESKGKSLGKGDVGGKMATGKGKSDAGGKMALTAGGPPVAGAMPSRFGKGGFKPNKLCTFWLADPSTCRKGADCTFAHGVQELQPGSPEAAGVSRFLHMQKPTKMCTFFANNACTKGLLCTFAHDESELVGG